MNICVIIIVVVVYINIQSSTVLNTEKVTWLIYCLADAIQAQIYRE